MPLRNPESHTASGWATRADELGREVEQLTRERDEARRDQLVQADRAEYVVEELDAVAEVLTRLGRPSEERCVDGVNALIAERDRLRALLREVEWGDDGTCCPCCRALKSPMDPEERWYLFSMMNEGRIGHAPDCRLKAALEE